MARDPERVDAIVGLLVLLPSTWLPRWAVAGLAAVLIATSLIVAHGGNTVIPGLFLLGSALVRYGVIDRMEQSARVPGVLGLVFAAGAAPALWWQAGLEAGDVRDSDLSLSLAVFAPLGRMALTNYLTATILVLAAGCIVGGLPDNWPLTTVVLIAGAVLAAQWLWSTLWLRRYRYGPLEWLWRWATWAYRPSLRHTP